MQQSLTNFKNNHEVPAYKKELCHDSSSMPINNQTFGHQMTSNGHCNEQQFRNEALLRQRIEEALQEIEIEAINSKNNREYDYQVGCAGFDIQANGYHSENSLNGLRSSSPKLVNSFDWLFPSSLWSPVNGWDFDQVCAQH